MDHGSSPRERGTGPPALCQRLSQRVIPARAGNRAALIAVNDSYGGSSPRERGTASGALPRHRRRRVIPARAGNRLYPAGSCQTRPGHPRESGEQIPSERAMISSSGSSPRERGTASIFRFSIVVPRVIPARAGNSDVTCVEPREPSGHPRESGEQSSASSRRAEMRGSSPRERGTDISVVGQDA